MHLHRRRAKVRRYRDKLRAHSSLKHSVSFPLSHQAKPAESLPEGINKLLCNLPRKSDFLIVTQSIFIVLNGCLSSRLHRKKGGFQISPGPLQNFSWTIVSDFFRGYLRFLKRVQTVFFSVSNRLNVTAYLFEQLLVFRVYRKNFLWLDVVD